MTSKAQNYRAQKNLGKSQPRASSFGKNKSSHHNSGVYMFSFFKSQLPASPEHVFKVPRSHKLFNKQLLNESCMEKRAVRYRSEDRVKVKVEHRDK